MWCSGRKSSPPDPKLSDAVAKATLDPTSANVREQALDFTERIRKVTLLVFAHTTMSLVTLQSTSSAAAASA